MRRKIGIEKNVSCSGLSKLVLKMMKWNKSIYNQNSKEKKVKSNIQKGQLKKKREQEK